MTPSWDGCTTLSDTVIGYRAEGASARRGLAAASAAPAEAKIDRAAFMAARESGGQRRRRWKTSPRGRVKAEAVCSRRVTAER